MRSTAFRAEFASRIADLLAATPSSPSAIAVPTGCAPPTRANGAPSRREERPAGDELEVYPAVTVMANWGLTQAPL
jgi:hypothetical protein